MHAARGNGTPKKRPKTAKEKGLEIHVVLRYNSIVTGAGTRGASLMQAYRSGHNEAVLKTVWVKAHGGSNPSACAKGFERVRNE